MCRLGREPILAQPKSRASADVHILAHPQQGQKRCQVPGKADRADEAVSTPPQLSGYRAIGEAHDALVGRFGRMRPLQAYATGLMPMFMRTGPLVSAVGLRGSGSHL